MWTWSIDWGVRRHWGNAILSRNWIALIHSSIWSRHPSLAVLYQAKLRRIKLWQGLFRSRLEQRWKSALSALPLIICRAFPVEPRKAWASFEQTPSRSAASNHRTRFLLTYLLMVELPRLFRAYAFLDPAPNSVYTACASRDMSLDV